MPFADAVGVGAIGLLALGTLRWQAVASVFLLTFFVYGVDRVVGVDGDVRTNPERTSLVRSQRSLQRGLIATAGVVAAALQAAAASWQAVLCAGLWAGIGMLYSFRLKNLSCRIRGFKAYVIGGMYGLWPLYIFWFHGSLLPEGAGALTVFVVMRMFWSTSFSDLKDVEVDRARGLRTFAAELSSGRFQRAMDLVNICSALPILAGIVGGSLPVAAAGLLLSIPVGVYSQRVGSGDRRAVRRVTAMVVDAEGFVWALGILLFRSL